MSAGVDVTATASGNVVLHDNVLVTAQRDVRLTAIDGEVHIGQSNTDVTVAAVRDVLVEAGNAIHQWDAGTVNAGQTITFRGDAIGIDDPAGATILIEGALGAVLIEVYGDADPDLITYTPWSLVGHTQIWAGTVPTASSSISYRRSISRTSCTASSPVPKRS